MHQRTLTPDGPVSSAIGLGCMGLSQGYGPADDAESTALIRRALDLGVTMLDTAQSYGSGHNETLIGAAINGRRDEVLLASKFGIVRDDDGVHLDGRPEHVAGFCDASLRRLGVDTIDLYYLHRVDPTVPVADTVGAMAELVTAGKVRHLGLSEVNVGQLEQAAAVHPIAAVQFEWSIMWREPEDDVIPAANRLGIGLVPYSPLGRGMLTGALATGAAANGDFRATDPRFAGPHLTANLAVVDALRELAADHDATVGQLALAWLLAQSPRVVPIPGTRRVTRLAENAAAARIDLSAADLDRLDEVAPRGAWAGDRRSFAAHSLTRTAPA